MITRECVRDVKIKGKIIININDRDFVSFHLGRVRMWLIIRMKGQNSFFVMIRLSATDSERSYYDVTCLTLDILCVAFGQ